MVDHSSILAWRILWTEETGGLQSVGVTQSQTQLEQLSMHTNPPCPLQAPADWADTTLVNPLHGPGRDVLAAVTLMW